MTNEKQNPQMDWTQVMLNGGPPCFFVEGPQYCGRAERWGGHGNKSFHDYVSLADLLATVRAEVEAEYALCRQVQKRGEHSSVTCPCVVAIEQVMRTEEREAAFKEMIGMVASLPTQGTMNYRRGYEEGVRDALRTLEAATENRKGEG